MKGISSKFLPAIVLALVLFLLILGGLTYALYFYKINQPVDVITDEDIKAITAGIKFSDVGNEHFLYQSPLFNFQVEINTKQSSYNDTLNGINISSRSGVENTKISVTDPYTQNFTFDLNKEADNYNKYIAAFKDGKVISQEDIRIDGQPAKKFVFSRKLYGDASYQGIGLLAINNNTLYTIEFTRLSGEALKGDEVNNIIATFKFIDSSKVNATTTYASSFYGYSFDYDSRFWKLDTGISFSVTLYERKKDLSIPQSAIITVTSESVPRQSLLGKEGSYLYDVVQQRIETRQGLSSFKTFKVTKNEDTTVAGRRAKILEYEAESTLETLPKYYREYIVLHYNTLTIVTINYPADSEALQQGEKLLQSFKVEEPTSGYVKGVTSETNSEEKVVVQSRPAVAQIFNRACTKFTVPISAKAQLPRSGGKTYNLCTAGTGTGFFVNSQGYIGTNGHVVVISVGQAVFNSIYYGLAKELLIDLYRDIILPQEIQRNPSAASYTDEQIYRLIVSDRQLLYQIATAILKTFTKDEIERIIDSEVYVQKGIVAFDINFPSLELNNKSSHLQAKVLDFNYKPLEDFKKETKSDVALVELEEKGDYPTLSLGDITSINIGSSVFVIGFPGVVEDAPFVSAGSKAEATVTKGIVSAIKESTSGRKLIQTDASLLHGNSGGPAINKDGQVIGIASLVVLNSSSADFNFLRDIEDLKEVMKENGVENSIGETETKWRAGVDAFFQGKFTESLKNLREAQNKYPELVGVDRLIVVAEEKKGQEKGQDDVVAFLQNMSGTEKLLFGLVSALLCLVLILISVVGISLVERGRKQGGDGQGGNGNTGVVSMPPVTVPPTEASPSSPITASPASAPSEAVSTPPVAAPPVTALPQTTAVESEPVQNTPWAPVQTQQPVTAGTQAATITEPTTPQVGPSTPTT